MFGLFKKKSPPPPERFPPVPDWQPAIKQPLDQIIERLRFYTNGKQDMAFFTHGTVVLLPDGLSDVEAEAAAKDVLSKIFNQHPDMNPTTMQDGNILVRYNHPAVNLVLDSVAIQHWAEIERNHLYALATDEVLITPQGHNVFDDFGKKALFGRCFMFMDAQVPRIEQLFRGSK
jgi:hypothetical protein